MSRSEMRALKEDTRVLKHGVNWQKSGLDHKPYKRWEEYWRNVL